MFLIILIVVVIFIIFCIFLEKYSSECFTTPSNGEDTVTVLNENKDKWWKYTYMPDPDTNNTLTEEWRFSNLTRLSDDQSGFIDITKRTPETPETSVTHQYQWMRSDSNSLFLQNSKIQSDFFNVKKNEYQITQVPQVSTSLDVWNITGLHGKLE